MTRQLLMQILGMALIFASLAPRTSTWRAIAAGAGAGLLAGWTL